jgi:hypothetical protein
VSTGLIDPLDDDAPEPAKRPAVPQKPTGPLIHLSGGHGWLETAAVALVCMALAVGVTAWWLAPGHDDGPAPSPGVYDPRFVSVGKTYLPALGPAYGAAWEDGAKVLDAGQPITMALDTVHASWEANRKALFNRRLEPELSKVVPQSKAEKEVTTEERAALAKAYRGLARGFSGK